MHTNFFAVWTRTRVIAIALTTLGLSGYVATVKPAAAKPMTCNAKYIGCTKRCFVAKEDDASWRCIERTCEHQFKNCMSDAAGGSDRTGTGAKGKGGGKTGPIVRDKRTPRRGADSPAPVTRSTPMGPPQPVTTGSGSTSAGGQPVVRDHRQPRAQPGGGPGRPFGIGPIRSTSRR